MAKACLCSTSDEANSGRLQGAPTADVSVEGPLLIANAPLRALKLRQPATQNPRVAALAAALAASVLAGCASAPTGPTTAGSSAAPRSATRPDTPLDSEHDGPEAHAPANLASVPDAEPRVEAIRAGGPNKPYEALGHDYVPIAGDQPFVERGLASWYGRKFQGRRTSSGEPYDMYAMTAAHPTLPIPSYARVRNPANGREVVVRINDRGPFHSGRIVDLSYTAALKLDLLRGAAPVELERITSEQIRTGSWRRSSGQTALAAVVPEPAASVPPAALLAATAAPAERAVLPPVTARLPAAAGALVPITADAPARIEAAALPTAPSADDARSPLRTGTAPAPGYWVQIGAFRERMRAESFERRIAGEFDWLAPLLAIVSETALYRLQAGPYASRDEAGGASRRIGQALRLTPVIVKR